MLADPDFRTVGEVAEIMRVSKMTVYRLIHTGELEARRIGRSFRVPAAAVTGYLNGAHVTPDQAGTAANGHAGSSAITAMPGAGSPQPGNTTGQEGG